MGLHCQRLDNCRLLDPLAAMAVMAAMAELSVGSRCGRQLCHESLIANNLHLLLNLSTNGVFVGMNFAISQIGAD